MNSWPVWTSSPPTLTLRWMCGVRPWYQPGKSVSKRTRPAASDLWCPRR